MPTVCPVQALQPRPPAGVLGSHNSDPSPHGSLACAMRSVASVEAWRGRPIMRESHEFSAAVDELPNCGAKLSLTREIQALGCMARKERLGFNGDPFEPGHGRKNEMPAQKVT